MLELNKSHTGASGNIIMRKHMIDLALLQENRNCKTQINRHHATCNMKSIKSKQRALTQHI